MKVFILTRKRIAVMAAVMSAFLCLGIFRMSENGTAAQANANSRSIPIYCVDTNEKKVSISFDAAWGNEQTQSLLDALEKYKVKSTFFLVGDWVRKYPDDVKKIAKAGHDVGNHSNTHPHMTELDLSGISKEITDCSDEIEALTGKKPTLFRPPYGDYNNNVVDTVKGLGMYCVQWDVDSLDWKELSTQEMCSRIKANIKNGSIILMHNGGKYTPQALPTIIETIHDMGYEIVPISQLLPKGDYTTDHTGKMIMNKTVSSDAQAKQTAAAVTNSSMNTSSSSDTTSRPKAVNSSLDTTSKSNNISGSYPSYSQTTSTYQGLKGDLDNMMNSSMKK